MTVYELWDKKYECFVYNILHWFDKRYVVPPSNSLITPVIWLQMYQSQQWSSFDIFIIWLTSCYIASPLNSCTYPSTSSMKLYTCKHSLGLGMLFNMYKIQDKTCSELLDKRRGKGRSKKVKSSLSFH